MKVGDRVRVVAEIHIYLGLEGVVREIDSGFPHPVLVEFAEGVFSMWQTRFGFKAEELEVL